jgi:hypothetical protein
MALKLILITAASNRSITPRLRKRQLHRFIEQLEALHLINRLLRRLHRVKDNECLALRLQVRLCDDVDDFAIFAEELAERLFELVDFDALFEIADVDPDLSVSGERCTCRSAMTRTLRLVGVPLWLGWSCEI